ncbi:phosphate ABC transporter ATP-binding protein, partial [Pseudomonas sp. NPDC089534]
MQHETHTHGINMSALGRDKQSLNLEQETVAIEVPGLSLFYG